MVKKWRKLIGFGHPKLPGTKFGWFGATFDFWSIFAILTLGGRLGVPPDYPPFWPCPTLLGLKMGQIWGFGPSSAQKSILRDSQMQKEVSGRPQIGLDNFLEHFSCGGLVRTGEFGGILGILRSDPEVLEAIY